MKIRYHIDREEDGIIILESPPQYRTFNTDSFAKGSHNVRIPLPYIYFTIRYVKYEGRIFYPGVYNSGLHICGSTKEINSFKEEIISMPTDQKFKGLICTNHSYDFRIFKSLKEICEWTISEWYGLNHHMEYDPFGYGPNFEFWKNLKLENLSNPDFKWKKEIFKDFLMNQKEGVGNIKIGNPRLMNIINYPDFIDLPTSEIDNLKITKNNNSKLKLRCGFHGHLYEN